MGPLRDDGEPARRRGLGRSTIAGSDSGGGAGIQADLKTFSALGVFGMTAITAVTVQNTKGVTGYEALSPETVGDQIRAVDDRHRRRRREDGHAGARAAIVEAVADGRSPRPAIPNLVVDPVFVSKHGHPLLAEDAVGALRARILPLATLVTPNLPEAGGLAGFAVKTTRRHAPDAADAILALGRRRGAGQGRAPRGDRAPPTCSVDGRRPGWLEAERIDTPHTHGTGCVAVVGDHRAPREGREPCSTRSALGKAFVTEAIRHALAIGQGIGPVDQLLVAAARGAPVGRALRGALGDARDLAGLQAGRADVRRASASR